jgi:hypothetical protein
MCMFCAAVPAVAAATAAVAQRDKRRQVEQASRPEPMPIHHDLRWLIPSRVAQGGALAVVGLLVGSAYYHTHFPG